MLDVCEAGEWHGVLGSMPSSSELLESESSDNCLLVLPGVGSSSKLVLKSNIIAIELVVSRLPFLRSTPGIGDMEGGVGGVRLSFKPSAQYPLLYCLSI